MDKKGILQALVTHYTGGNKSQFAKLLGVKPQTINTWDARGTFDLELIYSKCECISADWLLTGEGPMLKSGTPSPSEPAPKPKKNEKTSNTEGTAAFLSYMKEQVAAHAAVIKEKDAAIEQKNREIADLRCTVTRLETELRHHRLASTPAPPAYTSEPVEPPMPNAG